jgi:hypothetical protein
LCDELVVIDSCVVIDFCGRTDNLPLLMDYVGDRGVITTAVKEELEYRQRKTCPILQRFLDLVDAERVALVDPDMTDEVAARILATWFKVFGAGEVSSAAVAASRHWILLSVDREPMQQFSLREVIMLKTTRVVLAWLERRKRISARQAAEIRAAMLGARPRRRR